MQKKYKKRGIELCLLKPFGHERRVRDDQFGVPWSKLAMGCVILFLFFM